MAFQNPEAIGAVPAQGNPQAQQGPNLDPQQVQALKQDPEVIKAASMFVGAPVTLENLPTQALAELAGAVHKLGIDGAVAMLKQRIPQDVQAKIKAAVAQAAPQQRSDVAAPRG